MVDQGVLDDPKVEAVFGLHVFPLESGSLSVRAAGAMAGSDTLRIVVRGRQTHGAMPWDGVDPIVVASQIVLGLQTIVSRQANLSTAPAVLTIGIIQGGNRTNIIPDEVRLEGTLRTFDQAMRKDIQERVQRTATLIAQSAGATANVTFTPGNIVTYNDPALTARMTPSLRRAASGRFEPNAPVSMASEDFSQYQLKVPGVYFFLGVTAKGSRSEDGGAEPLAAVLRGRCGAGDRGAGVREPGGGLRGDGEVGDRVRCPVGSRVGRRDTGRPSKRRHVARARVVPRGFGE